VIREMFRAWQPVSPPSPQNSVAGSSVSRNNPHNTEMRDADPQSEELRDILCAFYQNVIEGDPIQHPDDPVCESCAQELRQRVSLQEHFEPVVNALNIAK